MKPPVFEPLSAAFPKVKRLHGALLVALLLSSPNAAHAMLRCSAPDGSVSYSSEQTPGDRCAEIGMPLTAAPLRVSTARPFAASRDTQKAGMPRIVEGNVNGNSTGNSTGNETTRTAEARIYAYLEDGVRHYTSSRPTASSSQRLQIDVIRLRYIESCYLCGPRHGLDVNTLTLDLHSFDAEIEAAAREFGVDRAIVRAVIHAESAFRPDVVSRAGAQGLMQLMPGTARELGVVDAFDAVQNIRGGVRYLAWLLERFSGNLDRVLAGFNAGAAAVDRYGGVPPYAETLRYVARVKALTERYRSAPQASESNESHESSGSLT